jgi:phosphonate transport system substrate-binding protein
MLSSDGALAACDNPLHLRFSLIPRRADVKQDAANFASLLKGLERELSRPVDVVLPTSYGSVIEGLQAGSIDLAMMGPASYAAAKNMDADVVAFATISKQAGAFQQEGPSYLSLLIVRRDSSFHTPESLKGARLALVDPNSTSGSVEPRHLFAPIIKMPFEKYFGRVVYSGGHDKSVAAVAKGVVDAAFVAGSYLSELVSDGKAKQEDFRVLWHSEPIPFSPIVYRGQLCDPIKNKIRDAFLRSNGEAYPDVLEDLKAIRFVPVSDDRYRVIREILRTTP